jgi:hypothetical protein
MPGFLARQVPVVRLTMVAGQGVELATEAGDAMGRFSGALGAATGTVSSATAETAAAIVRGVADQVTSTVSEFRRR